MSGRVHIATFAMQPFAEMAAIELRKAEILCTVITAMPVSYMPSGPVQLMLEDAELLKDADAVDLITEIVSDCCGDLSPLQGLRST